MLKSQIEHQIIGHDMQMLEFNLMPGDSVIAEAGAMTWLDADIRFKTRMGDGSETGFMGKLWNASKRVLSGESLFLTHFSNEGMTEQKAAFSAPYPGTIVPVSLDEVGGALLCQKGAFLAAEMGTSIDIAFTKKLGAGMFGGEGFVLQRLEGEGAAYVHGGGTLIKRELHGETIKVDTGCLVAFTTGIQYDIEIITSLRSGLFAGEGAVLTTLSGYGTVWIQSLPFSRLVDRIIAQVPTEKK